MNPPRPGRTYWICQAAGWGSFTAYVLGFYLYFAAPHRVWDIFSIVFFNSILCPAVTHALRRQLYVREWLQLPLLRLFPLVIGIQIVVAFVLTVAVGAGAVLSNPLTPMDPAGLLGVFVGFCWALIGWFVIYYAVIARRRRDALQLELAVVTRDAQLRSLRAQINPHFLFNSLNSLRHLIIANPDRAVAMVTGLADLLRYSLASDRTDLVSLGEELEVVDQYLELERIRFEERLRIERAIEPFTLRARVPPMLIQGLVDNAIKHGISELPRGGVVQISARWAEPHVQIRIANTGALKPSGSRGGSGLKNATERLQLLYNGAASLTLTEADGMTIAELHLPLERQLTA